MADGAFNIAKGAAAEKFRDNASNGIVALMSANNAESGLIDHDDLSALFGTSGNTEAAFTNYGRKTGLTGSITVDDSNDRVDIDFPDQTWSSAGNGTNETLTKLLTAFEEPVSTPTDSDRIPLTHHDFSVTTDGSDLTAQFNSAGFFRSS